MGHCFNFLELLQLFLNSCLLFICDTSIIVDMAHEEVLQGSTFLGDIFGLSKSESVLSSYKCNQVRFVSYTKKACVPLRLCHQDPRGATMLGSLGGTC